jgi:superfamily II DNA or RNA helicase
MCDLGLKTKKDATQWFLEHHPDKGGQPTSADFGAVGACLRSRDFCTRKSMKAPPPSFASLASPVRAATRKTRTAAKRDISRIFGRVQHKSAPRDAPEQTQVVAYEPNARQLQCIRQVSNWSKIVPNNRFNKSRFSVAETDKLIPIASPKLEAMLQNIQALDENDMTVTGRKFKHFIFSDIKLLGYGAKIISAGMIARGFKPIIKFEKNKIVVNIPAGGEGNNFAVLSSTALWDSPFKHKLKKEILDVYNARPDNIHGENCRFIVLDAGFKEGIDLFDVKYVHLFEPLMTSADLTQALGRATRLCGQKGLDFVPNRGWPLHVFKYSQSIPDSLKPLYKADTLFEIALQLKGLDTRLHRITKSINDVSIVSAVDQPLTEELHKSDILPKVVERAATKQSVEMVRTMNTVTPKNATLSTPARSEMLRLENKQYTAAESMLALENKQPTRMLALENGTVSERISDQDSDGESESDPCSPRVPNSCLSGAIVPFKPSRLATEEIMPTVVMETNALVIRAPSSKAVTPRTVSPGKSKGPVPTTWYELRQHIISNYKRLAWAKQEVVNKCGPPPSGGAVTRKMTEATAKRLDDLEKIYGTKAPARKVSVMLPVGRPAAKAAAKTTQKKGLMAPTKASMAKVTAKAPTKAATKAEAAVAAAEAAYEAAEAAAAAVIMAAEAPVAPTKAAMAKLTAKAEALANAARAAGAVADAAEAPAKSVAKAEAAYVAKAEAAYAAMEAVEAEVAAEQAPTKSVAKVTAKAKAKAKSVAKVTAKAKGKAPAKAKAKAPTKSVAKVTAKAPTKATAKAPTKSVAKVTAKAKAKVPEPMIKKKAGPALKLIDYTPTQAFISSYFTVESPIKGMILWHSVGTGKTCSAIALASSQFEPAGYTIIWVTRHTLKADIWKNIFEQVCHSTIADEVARGLLKSEDVERRQRRLYQQWIPPMSYRQFSNTVQGKNPLYQMLKKRNGKEDPLRKTLIIIDEAHKLYSSDFKGAEKPDVGAFMAGLQNSYKVSGSDSARVLLMTATPYNESPMELMALLNLCRTEERALPTEIPDFVEKYMDADGNFTKEGLHTYMDDIAGQISYLNREADPSQFAQPIFLDIDVPISTYDNVGAGDTPEILQMRQDLLELKQEQALLVEETIPYLEGEIAKIGPSEAAHLKECEATFGTGKPKDLKECIKRVTMKYKAGLKLEERNLREARKRADKINIQYEKMTRKIAKAGVAARKKGLASLTQQGQLETRCKIGVVPK